MRIDEEGITLWWGSAVREFPFPLLFERVLTAVAQIPLSIGQNRYSNNRVFYHPVLAKRIIVDQRSMLQTSRCKDASELEDQVYEDTDGEGELTWDEGGFELRVGLGGTDFEYPFRFGEFWEYVDNMYLQHRWGNALDEPC